MKPILIHTIENTLNQHPGRPWWVLTGISFMLMLIGAWAAWQSFFSGVGEWGLTSGITWGTGIVHFVWWVGIGHAGTFISAVLFMLHQPWRNSINRMAETMTLVAILCAAFYPVIHLGRAYLAYSIFPYANTRDLGVNFNSPLVWDFFAIGSYLLVSFAFWFLGLLPDLHLFKDAIKRKWLAGIYRFLSQRWTGEVGQWRDYSFIYKIIASLSAALVVSVHSIVSLDFAVSNIHGWHSTIFPPFFVVGAIFSGFAMVQLILRAVRYLYNLNTYITDKQLDNINKIILVSSIIMSFSYISEVFLAVHSGIEHEAHLNQSRLWGTWSPSFYSMILFNSILPLLFFLKKLRRNPFASIAISVGVLIGMWFERWIIVVSLLQTSAFSFKEIEYKISVTEFSLFLGTIGFFLFILLLATRIFPLLSVHEILHGKNYKDLCHDNTRI